MPARSPPRTKIGASSGADAPRYRSLSALIRRPAQYPRRGISLQPSAGIAARVSTRTYISFCVPGGQKPLFGCLNEQGPERYCDRELREIPFVDRTNGGLATGGATQDESSLLDDHESPTRR